MKRIEVIEFLRGYSIFTIVAFHYLMQFGMPFPYDKGILFGGTGLHLFVLLSGFGLYLSHLNRPLAYGAFLRKRLAKVYIPYIIVVFFSAFVALFFPIFENSWYALGGHVFLYKMFDEHIISSYGHPLWFISLIIQLYLLFHFFVLIKRKAGSYPFLAICTLSSLLWSLTIVVTEHIGYRVWNGFFLQFLWEFALGMYLASLWSEKRLSIKMKPLHFFLLGVLGCTLYALAALKLGTVGQLFNDIPALIGYSSLAIGVYQMNIKWIRRFFTYTGKISYPLFLLHVLVLRLCNTFLEAVLPTALILCISLALSYLFSHYYQKIIDRHLPGLTALMTPKEQPVSLKQKIDPPAHAPQGSKKPVA